MRKSGFRVVVFAVLLVPLGAFALGLGRIHSNTRIGQQFEARIPILGATSNDLSSLKVKLASASAYKQAGLQEPDFLFDLHFKVINGGGKPYIAVTSEKPIHLPFLNLLIHASWSSGALTRQYTVLLNPPVFASGNSASASNVNTAIGNSAAGPSSTANSSTPRPAAKSETTPRTSHRIVPQQSMTANTSTSAGQGSAVGPPAQSRTYGPVAHGATLWGLAHRLRPSRQVTINQMMIALYRTNPGAFQGNINRLKAGYVLRVPTAQRVKALSNAQATRLVAQQNQSWKRSQAGTQPNTKVASNSVPSRQSNATGQTTSQSGATRAGQSKPTTSGKATAQGAAAKAASGSANSGRVVLSAPSAKTGSVSAVTSTAATTSSTSQAAGITQPGAGQAHGAKSANGVSATPHKKIPNSSAAPVKVASNSMANLTAKKPSQPKQSPVKPKAAAAQHAMGTGNSGGSPRSESAYANWLTSPKGWILAAALILLLLALARWSRQRKILVGSDRDRPGEADGRRDQEDGSGEGGATALAEGQEPGYQSPDHSVGTSARSVTEESYRQGGAGFIGGSAGNEEMNDPIADADFHMAYGLNEQAIGVLTRAHEQQPERRDIKLKLLDAYFAANDRENYVQLARQLRDEMGITPDEDWDAVAAMGRQIAPGDDVFAEPSPATGDDAASEVSSPASSSPVGDSDSLEPEPQWTTEITREAEPDGLASDSVVEGDTTIEKAESDAGEDSPYAFSSELEFEEDRSVSEFSDGSSDVGLAQGEGDADSLDFTAEAPVAMTSRELSSDDGAAVENSDESGLSMPASASDAGPMESTDADDSNAGLSIDFDLDKESQSEINEVKLQGEEEGSVAESDVDFGDIDLELDLDNLSGQSAQPLQSQQEFEKTMDELSTFIETYIPGGVEQSPDLDLPPDDELTEALETGEFDEIGGTASRAEPDEAFDTLDMDLPASEEIELTGDEFYSEGESLEQPESDDAAGTKLDLARAYIDMGDNEAANSILEEVLDEGNDEQRHEAERLLSELN